MPERNATRAAEEAWTTRRLLDWMAGHFQSRKIDESRVVAEMLLCHVLGCERMRLYMEVDRPASPEELAALRELVRRAAEHEPVHYLVGRRGFFGREFLVDHSTLIPQPCTEELVSRVVRWCADRRAEIEGPGDEAAGEEADAAPPWSPLIADIGTGTGCIAVSLALHVPHARLMATDIVTEALALAGRNAARFDIADRIEFIEGSLLEPLHARGDGERFDVICSNPPYIPDHEWESGQVDEGVREYVAATALRGGPDGLEHIRPLIAGAGALLKPGGLLALEIADCQRDAVLDISASAGLVGADVHRDLEGHWRIFMATKRCS
jgi:release factor glutamine methyltransferase